MKLAEWARQIGISYRTAWEYFRTGKIPGAYKLATGTIIVPEEKPEGSKQEYVVTYARASSAENKDNLDTQNKRLADFCAAKGWIVSKAIKEIGSGLNDKRRKLEETLIKGRASKLVVEHKDRLTRFGFNFISILCKHIDCELVVINENADDEERDIIDDFVAVITSFCARVYGKRRSKRKTKQIIEELKKNDS